MVPQKKIVDLIKKHAELETELSSGKVDKKLFADKSKEYSDLNDIIKSVKLPKPGPISTIFSFFMFVWLVIFLIIFLSIRKFCPSDFFGIIIFISIGCYFFY